MFLILQRRLKALFNVREGEGQRVLLMFLTIFLIITTLLIVKPTVTGLFLSEVGVERLPLVYVLIATFAIAISRLYSSLLERISFKRLIIGTLGVSVGILLVFGLLLMLPLQGNWLYYCFFVWSAVFGVLAASQFWILANMIFNVREAKRLFGLVSVGAIAGGIFGGYLTAILSQVLGAEYQFFVAAFLLTPCIPITHYIWQRYIAGQTSTFQRKKKVVKAERSFSLIRQSPHLTNLAGVIGVSVIVAKLVDYQFSAIAAARFTDPDELTAFFGFWFSTFNIVSLLIQLLLTQKVVGILGIGRSLMIQPLIILLGAFTLLFFPVLAIVIFIKMSDSSLKQSLNKASLELLSLPVPGKIKSQTKTFIDVVVDSIATGVGGLLLIFFIRGLDLSTSSISILILGLVLIWLWLIRRVHRTYLQSFRTQLLEVEGEPPSAELPHHSILDDFHLLLARGEDHQILALLKKLEQQPDDRLAADLFQLLDHPSPAIREASLRAIYYVPDPAFEEKVNQLVYTPVRRIRSAAISYLVTHTSGDRYRLAAAFLEDEQIEVRRAALIGIARESRHNTILQEQFNLRSRLDRLFEEVERMNSEGEAFIESVSAGLKAIGHGAIGALYPKIHFYLHSKVQALQVEAIQSAGLTLDAQFILPLLQALAKEDLADAARTALIKYGPAVVRPIAEYLDESTLPSQSLINLSGVLAPMGSQDSVDLMFQLANLPHRAIRRAILPALNQAKNQYPHLRFPTHKILKYIIEEARIYQDTLSILYVQRTKMPGTKQANQGATLRSQYRQELIHLLEKRLDHHIEGIFHLLRLKYRSKDIESIYVHLRSQNAELRMSALEYLDNILEPNLRQIILPIIETAQLEAITEQVIRSLKWRIPREQECYQLLMEREDPPLNELVRKIQALLPTKH